MRAHSQPLSPTPSARWRTAPSVGEPQTGRTGNSPASTKRANLVREARTPARNGAFATGQPRRPRTPMGRSRSSLQINRLRCCGRATTSIVPVPRTNDPVCSTSTRWGGSQLVITMVSQNPSGPAPVHAAISEPTDNPSPPRNSTRVPSIQAPWSSQAVMAANTCSGGASMSISRLTCAGFGAIRHLYTFHATCPPTGSCTRIGFGRGILI